MMLSMLRRRRRFVGAVSSIIIPKNINNLFPHRAFVSTLSLSPSPWNPSEAIKLHGDALYEFNTLIIKGVSDISLYNNVFSSFFNLGSFIAIPHLFQQLESAFPDIHTWLMLISCHSEIGNISTAFSLFRDKIIDTGHRPTTSTLNHLLNGLCQIGESYKAMLFYHYIILKGFRLDRDSYHFLIRGLCRHSGETQRAIQLLREVLLLQPQIDTEQDYDFHVMLYNIIIFRLCKDRLVHQAYDLYSEMIHVTKINPDFLTHCHLLYGYCIVGQFKQAIWLDRELEKPNYNPSTGLVSMTKTAENALRTSKYIPPCISALNLVTEQEVKDAKTVAAVMIKAGIRPNFAAYKSVINELYKRGKVEQIAKTVEMLLFHQSSLELYYSDPYW